MGNDSNSGSKVNRILALTLDLTDRELTSLVFKLRVVIKGRQNDRHKNEDTITG